MADVIDSLKVQIDASTQSADAKMDIFIEKMKRLQSVITGVEMSGASQVASGINQISLSIQNFNNRTKTADFSRVTSGLNRLSGVDVQGVNNAAQAIRTFSNSITGINTQSFDSQKFVNLASSISKLGRVSVTEATQNLEFLKTSMVSFVSGMNSVGALNFNPDSLTRVVSSISKLGGVNATQAVQNLPHISTYLRDFISSMNSVGSVSFNFEGLNSLVNNISRLGGAKATQAAANLRPLKDQILRFVSGLNGMGALNFDTAGLANLVSSITRLGGSAATASIPNIEQLGAALIRLMSTLSRAPTVSQNLIQMTNALAALASNGTRVSSVSSSMSSGLNMYSRSANRAAKSTMGLVSQIGMFYARCFLLIRGVKALWRATKSAMDYIETLNYFDAAWGQVAETAAGKWKEAGYDSAEAYARSFEERSRVLTGKMAGFQPDEFGNLVSTGMPSLGLNPEQTMNYQATFGQMASSMGVASETALKLSNALTMIGADLASVKNLSFEKVWQDMASGMVGMSRTLDKYGVNIRNVNLQQKLSELGIKANITAINQQDKALLRAIILLDSTRYAWGDLAETLGQPANMLRLLQANFSNLARTIGSLLLPVVSKVLPYVNALVIALQRLFSWIGGLLGIKIGGFSSSIGSAATEFGDMEDTAGGIADSTGDAAKNTKKMADNLQGFDKLNVISSSNDSGGSGGSGGGGAGGILDDAFADAFAEYQATWDAAFADMENSAQNMADRIVEVFGRIWEAAEPTREALVRLGDEGFARLSEFTWTALEDFYNEFLIPIGNWTLGTGLPMLIDNINAFLMKVDFPAINDALKNFWQALEPFAEKVGEGLITFFGDLLSVGADFINYIVPNGLNGVAGALKKIDPNTAEKIGYALGIVATGIMGFKAISSAVTNVTRLNGPLGKLFSLVGPMKYVAIAAGIGGLVVALDEFGVIDVNWNSFAKGFKNLASALGKFVRGIGDGLINFIEGITPIVSPALETIINGIGAAFEFFAKVLNRIPESVISGLTNVLLSFFGAFKTYEMVVKVGGLIQGFANSLQLFGSALPGLVNSGSIFQNLTTALGPTALGAIAFSVIAGGLLAIASNMSKMTDEAAKNSAIGQFSDAIRELNEEVSSKTEQINASLESTRKEVESAGVAEGQMARDLAKEYEELSSKASLSADEKQRLKEVSQNLVDIIPTLGKHIDGETDYLNVQKESLDKLIIGYESLAQKKAAQEGLEQAYKNQYEAQLNLNNAREAGNKAEDEYLKKSGLTQKAIDDLKNGTIDLTTLVYDYGSVIMNGERINLEDYGFRSDDVGAFRKAIEGANKVMAEHNAVTADAEDVYASASNELLFYEKTVNDANKEMQNMTAGELAGRVASEEYKQALSDLSTTFGNLDLSLSDNLMQNLALNDFDTTVLEDFFTSLSEGVTASEDELSGAFEQLGLTLPKFLTDAMVEQTPDIQATTTKTLMAIQSGVEANAGQLETLFVDLGIELPGVLSTNLANMESTVQTRTLELLSKIEAGYALKGDSLLKLFSGLGLYLPVTMMESLASKEAETQVSTIQLLGQIAAGYEGTADELLTAFGELGIELPSSLKSALESENENVRKQAVTLFEQLVIADENEREELLKRFDTLGTDTSNSLNTGLGSNNAEIKTTTETMIKNVKDPIMGEFGSSEAGFAYEGGANASKGFWQGMKDWWDESWLTQKIDDFKTTITGKAGLDQHSPSRVMREYGGFAIEGFNIGLKGEMSETMSLMQSWVKQLDRYTNGYQISFPGNDVTYSINREIFEKFDTTAALSFDNSQYDFKASISAELKSALSDIIDYDKLGDVLVEKLEQANITAELDSQKAYSNVKENWRKEFKRNKKAPVPF